MGFTNGLGVKLSPQIGYFATEFGRGWTPKLLCETHPWRPCIGFLTLQYFCMRSNVSQSLFIPSFLYPILRGRFIHREGLRPTWECPVPSGIQYIFHKCAYLLLLDFWGGSTNSLGVKISPKVSYFATKFREVLPLNCLVKNAAQ